MRPLAACLTVCLVLTACHTDKTPRFPDWPYWKDWASGYVEPDLNRPSPPQVTITVIDGTYRTANQFQNDLTVKYPHADTLQVLAEANCVGGVHDLVVEVDQVGTPPYEVTVLGEENSEHKVPITLKHLTLGGWNVAAPITIIARARNFRLDVSDVTVKIYSTPYSPFSL